MDCNEEILPSNIVHNFFSHHIFLLLVCNLNLQYNAKMKLKTKRRQCKIVRKTHKHKTSIKYWKTNKENVHGTVNKINDIKSISEKYRKNIFVD